MNPNEPVSEETYAKALILSISAMRLSARLRINFEFLRDENPEEWKDSDPIAHGIACITGKINAHQGEDAELAFLETHLQNQSEMLKKSEEAAEEILRQVLPRKLEDLSLGTLHLKEKSSDLIFHGQQACRSLLAIYETMERLIAERAKNAEMASEPFDAPDPDGIPQRRESVQNALQTFDALEQNLKKL
jgi:hypothetical protein